MSNASVTYLVGACAGVFGLAAWLAFIVVPAWSSYTRLPERLAAVFLSLYVLATFVGLGVLAGAAVVFYSDRF